MRYIAPMKKPKKGATATGKTQLIYTLGRKSIYDPLFGRPRKPMKGKGGSVWETHGDAEAYRMCMREKREYGVYGVVADWDRDTKPTGKDAPYRDLNRDATLVQLGL